MPPAIEHDRDMRRFTLLIVDYRCVLEYRLADAVMTITHTWVPEPLRGRGIAAGLAGMAFDTARSEGWKVVPACSYAAAFARKHAEYADLIA